MINEYFTLLASLEYNMQEIQKVQKLANDLVDISVTVRSAAPYWINFMLQKNK